MRVKELKAILDIVDDDLEVFIKRDTLTGNIKELATITEDTYGFFGESIPCIILDDKYKELGE